MKNHQLRFLLSGFLVLLISSCQGLQPNQEPSNPVAAVTECRQYLGELNHAIEEAGLRDAQTTILPDFPHLRVDRFLASLLPGITGINSATKYQFWLEQSAALAREGFDVELDNLGLSGFRNQVHNQSKNIDDARRLTNTCIQTLLTHEKKTGLPNLQLQAQAIVKDNYKLWKRALGIYPLVVLPAAWGIKSHQKKSSNAHQKTGSPEQNSYTETIYPPPSEAFLSGHELETIFSEASNNALSLPLLSPQNLERLFQHYAPVWVVHRKGAADDIGTMSWSPDGSLPLVQTDRATVYTQVSYTRFRGKSLLQLNYIIWFPERPLTSAFDLLGGYLDGINWRVTLDSRGQILMQDTMHNCGCYHMFYPGSRLSPKKPPDSLAEMAFVPKFSPDLKNGERHHIHITHTSHYIIGLDAKMMPAMTNKNYAKPYKFGPYKNLRKLPHPKFGNRSMFNDTGLVPGSRRRERYFFWPLGISSPGAMRQWGNHATAFIGRRHFDDPDLIEKSFILKNDQKIN
ncbi:MAG: hypothetical protein ACC635_01740 [Acidiferrobacterales bacterium]